MKRFTTAAAVFGVGILAFWSIFQLFTASQAQQRKDNAPARVQPENNGVTDTGKVGSEHVVPVTGLQDRKIAPVFDGSSSVVSDPSGAILNAGNLGALAIPAASSDVNVAPVFDASGTVVSNPSGISLNASPSGLIAPVFDANGAVVSDPSGTILNFSTP